MTDNAKGATTEVPVYYPPEAKYPWWSTPAFWPADLFSLSWLHKGWLIHIFWKPYQWASRFGFWTLDRWAPETRYTHRACPCTFTPGSEHFYMEDPDPNCDICWGSGNIWEDPEGNVCGNTFDRNEEEAAS